MALRHRLKRTVAPDDFAFRELFEANYPMVLRHLILILGDQTAAEDIAQETFIRLYERPPKEFTNLSGWLIKISTNLAYNYLRGEKSRKRREMADTPVMEIYADDFYRMGETEEVREALRRLDYRDRVLIVLKFYGFSYLEISEMTGVKKASVGKSLARALEKFQKAYERKS
ncbi:MAG: sigma-70 family RNA polymerase sigma factor [Actinomycetota bacterium]|nr:sigma-70 family RNA polymerase sigma factor [Actinomycetota bacterium]